jgi:hypothetical protein
MKLFKNLGIENYDIVPEWAKPIIQYVLTNEGLSIIKYKFYNLETFIQFLKESSPSFWGQTTRRRKYRLWSKTKKIDDNKAYKVLV